MAILKLKIKRVGTYANEAPIYGELVSKNDYRQISHWKACDSIRHTDKGKTYLYLAVETSIKDIAILFLLAVKVLFTLPMNGMNYQICKHLKAVPGEQGAEIPAAAYFFNRTFGISSPFNIY